MPAAEGLASAIQQMEGIQDMLNQLAKGKLPEGMSMLDMMPASVKKDLDSDTKKEIANIRSISDINESISEMDDAKEDMYASIGEMEASQAELAAAMTEMGDSVANLKELSEKMQKLRDAVPGAFEEAENNYMLSIEEERVNIEKVFQNTLNKGFKDIYVLVAVAGAVAMLLLIGYSTRKEKQRMDGQI